MSRTRRPSRSASPPPAAGTPETERAALALWIALAVLAAARLVLAFTPGMWVWGLNTQRFLDPLSLWLPWALAALSLVPPVARRLEPAAARLGDALARGSTPAALALAILVALLAWGSPDNTRFVGDFLLRQGTVEMAGKPAVLFPQALPLDVLLHYTLPTALQEAHLLSANTTARLLGVLNAALLAFFAARLTRALGFTGAAATAAWAVAVLGVDLGMFTGYSKPLAELAMLAVAIAAFGVRFAREGRGALGLGVALAVGLALHRSALGFMIPFAVAWVIATRRARAPEPGSAWWRRPANAIALVIPIATLVVAAPRMIHTLLHVDVAVHLLPAEARHAGILGAAFSGLRALDLLNLVLLLAPLAPLAALAALTRLARPARPASPGPDRERGIAAAVLLALALPMLAATPFIHPAQGLFRDWDDFAAMGAALALIGAWLAGDILEGARTRRWVAVPLAAAALMSTIQWLALHTDVDQGLARARAFVTEPPPRTDIERAGVWDFLGIRNYRLDRWAASAEAFSHAVESAPSPRLLQQWAFAATMAGELRTAQAVYHRLLEKDPKNPSAWLGLGAVASRIPDVDDSFWATRKLLELDPQSPGAHRLMDYLRKTYPTHP